jgi:ribosomal protein L11 methyltransferase
MKYTQVKITISPLIQGRELIYHVLEEEPYEYFEDEVDGLSAYVPTHLFSEHKLKDALEKLKDEFKSSYEIIHHPDQNWNADWESNFHPIEVDGKCFIRAPFHDPHPSLPEVIILPQMSFGTGHHETTWLMAKSLFDIDFKGKKVLDMGCGTGILAILASKLSASSVLAIDIEEWAYLNTIENISLNKAINITVEKGGAELLASRLFNIILANINLNVLLNDMNSYSQCLEKGGVILFSGVFGTDLPQLQKRAEECGLVFVSKEEKNNWMVARFTK